MTRQDFEKLAGVIREQVLAFHQWDIADLPAVTYVLQEVAGDIADVCESSNGLFDREKFLIACGLPE